ncbi:S8 family serine peptidase [Kordia sp.]|uniref:S8 family serine peptidase n=1 Tax=Kordia sp. TaxID=1965332 RepID=UPI003D271559
MKLLKLVTLFSICYCIISCASVKSPKAVTFAISKKQPLTEEEKKDWYFKDIYKDSIPGISLHKAYDFLNNKKGDTIIVAVIDTELDIAQEDLKNQIWINKDEIPNNNIDDDNNGYVDDIHGWNFLGTTEKTPIIHHKSTAVRILNKYNKYKNVKESEVKSSDLESFKLYKRALNYQKEKIDEAKLNLKYFQGFKERFLSLRDTMKTLFNKEKFTVKELDSLSKKSNDSIIKVKISSTKYLIQNGIDEKRVNQIISIHKNNLDMTYNLEHDDRLTDDDLDDINDSIYGNNNVRGTAKMDHGTKVAGVIAGNRFNEYGVIGITNKVRIMPVVISSFGNENDKDIALAIRYAVNNGAKVINMSIGKEFSINEKWIREAIIYADKKDVLIISAAGNEGLNLDTKDIFYYPNDMDKDKNEFSNNFIAVGSSNYTENIVSNFSNYGQTTVDVFAPGEEIKVLTNDGVGEDSGSSLSCAVVSGIASLIRSYYPALTAKEVKELILKSGISVDTDVYAPVSEGQKRNPNKVPFSSLSKSGKIVNAYNALLMAEEVSKKKKRRKK